MCPHGIVRPCFIFASLYAGAGGGGGGGGGGVVGGGGGRPQLGCGLRLVGVGLAGWGAEQVLRCAEDDSGFV
jgi:hypothetical protein